MVNRNEVNGAEIVQKTSSLARPAFPWRALTSVIITVCFVFQVVSGLVLWAAPPGRIANWTDWAMLGLRKHDWIGLCLWFSAT